MFAFPSTLYQTLQMFLSQGRKDSVKFLLEALKTALDEVAKSENLNGILMDTSPFYAGGTHLAWCAADALIIPVRVDEHSLASLDLTLQMLSDQTKDFIQWNDRAGGRKSPKVAAIVMTMVGNKSQVRAKPDRASMMFIERAVLTAQKYPQLFDQEDPADAIAITDDFLSAGRISGAKSIPISQLTVKSFHTVDGKRLQVNQSVERYQRQLDYLVSVI